MHLLTTFLSFVLGVWIGLEAEGIFYGIYLVNLGNLNNKSPADVYLSRELRVLVYSELPD